MTETKHRDAVFMKWGNCPLHGAEVTWAEGLRSGIPPRLLHPTGGFRSRILSKHFSASSD